MPSIVRVPTLLVCGTAGSDKKRGAERDQRGRQRQQNEIGDLQSGGRNKRREEKRRSDPGKPADTERPADASRPNPRRIDGGKKGVQRSLRTGHGYTRQKDCDVTAQATVNVEGKEKPAGRGTRVPSGQPDLGPPAIKNEPADGRTCQTSKREGHHQRARRGERQSGRKVENDRAKRGETGKRNEAECEYHPHQERQISAQAGEEARYG